MVNRDAVLSVCRYQKKLKSKCSTSVYLWTDVIQNSMFFSLSYSLCAPLWAAALWLSLRERLETPAASNFLSYWQFYSKMWSKPSWNIWGFEIKPKVQKTAVPLMASWGWLESVTPDWTLSFKKHTIKVSFGLVVNFSLHHDCTGLKSLLQT